MKIAAHKILFFLCLSLVLFPSESVFADALQAEAVVQADAVYVGDPFTFLIQVSGTDRPDPPDLSGLRNFNVEYQGGSQNNSSSITIINGKMTKTVRRGYVFSYQLTPQQPGRQTIPAIPVPAEGRMLQTQPVTIHVLEPEKTDDIQLQLFLSKDHCHVGEPVTLTVIWYLRADVRSFHFTIPLLDQTDWFYFADPDVVQDPARKYYRIPLATGEVIAEEGEDTLAGEHYATISFSKILIPKKSGELHIDPATLSCEILTGYRKTQRRNPFGDDFFSGVFNDDFFASRQGIFKKVVVPSNGLRLIIDDLPAAGKPANFRGHVGEYQISASAAPTEVNVGDPITLTIMVSGPEYLDHVTLPPLSLQADLIRDFKIPQDQAPGEIRGKTKVFTQTIRALHADVAQIPAIELPYFSPASKKYEIARTTPIPLTVHKTRVVTALDAEGRSLPAATGGGEVETWTKGIAHNYEDLSVIEHQRTGFSLIRSPLWITIVASPPLLYLILLMTWAAIRKNQADPRAIAAKKAFSRLNAELKNIRADASDAEKINGIQDALRRYLGARLGMRSRAIVYADVDPVLKEKGTGPELADALKSIFDDCEAGRYAGKTDGADPATLSAKTLEVAKNLENLFK